MAAFLRTFPPPFLPPPPPPPPPLGLCLMALFLSGLVVVVVVMVVSHSLYLFWPVTESQGRWTAIFLLVVFGCNYF